VERPLDTLIIDEVQLEPRLFRAIKAAVDRDRRPGRFLLTGSARLLSAPDMANALVGRVETIDLWPFTHGEITDVTDRFVDLIFEDHTQLLRNGEFGRGDYIDPAVRGGFPEAVQRTPGRRRDWFEAYATTIVQRAVLALSNIDRIAEIPQLVRLCGVEVKASSTITARDFRGLKFLKERLGERFANGVVLHTANEALTFGDRLAALPLSALWSDR
jgi:uncharacterized protein